MRVRATVSDGQPCQCGTRWRSEALGGAHCVCGTLSIQKRKFVGGAQSVAHTQHTRVNKRTCLCAPEHEAEASEAAGGESLPLNCAALSAFSTASTGLASRYVCRRRCSVWKIQGTKEGLQINC